MNPFRILAHHFFLYLSQAAKCTWARDMSALEIDPVWHGIANSSPLAKENKC